MTKETPIHDIIKGIGEESLVGHLREKIAQDQRSIALLYSGVDPMAYPANLLGDMEQLLAKREYRAIEAKIKCWQQWIENARKVQSMLERTLILIESFVMWYQVANGGADE